MMAAIILQNTFFPPPPANVAKQPPAAADAENPPVPAEAVTADNEVAKPDSEQPQTGAETSDQKASATEPGLAADQAAPADVTDTKPTAVNKLITLGSLDPASGYRFLVTLNTEGATVRRVEINVRDNKGGIKYRELETDYGYLGQLECVDSPNGCQVRTVGDGTPAAIAGLKPGDVITSLAGRSFGQQPVTSAADFSNMISRTRPKEQLEIEVERDGKPITCNATLTDIPIEILRPEPPILDPNYNFPESFLLTLRKPLSGKDWPELDPGMRKANWEVKEIDDDGQRKVEFSYEVAADTLKPFDLPGPVKVFKRFWLEKLSAENIADLDSRSWDLKFELEIENLAANPVGLAYQLDGPTGLPTEGWWYQMKIHGRSTAIGSLAGARDVVGSSEGNSFVFLGGPEIVKNSLKSMPKKLFLFSPFEDDPIYRKVNFLGVDTQYFNVMLIPDQSKSPYYCYSAMAWHTGAQVPKKPREQRLVDVTPLMFTKVDLDGNGGYNQDFEIFCGPKEPGILEAYGLDDTRTFGWFNWVSQGLCWLLHLFYNLTFQISYGISIVLLTVLVRSCMIPFSRRTALNAQMMQHLQPQIKEIADKYKDDMEKRAQLQRELFKRHNYNPFGGCFMGLVQLPIFLGLYRGLSVDIALRDQPLIPGVQWCSNLAAPDHLLNWQSWMPAFLSAPTGWLGPYLNILPIITMALFMAQQKLFMPPATDDQQKMMQKMMSFMMIFMGFVFFKVPSGLCIYFITSSIWGIIERKMLPKPVLDTSKLPLEGVVVEKKAPVQEVEKTQRLTNDAEMANRKRRDRERRKRLKERGQ
jgi:YidC/Oxa1 family membrane protein insertase